MPGKQTTSWATCKNSIATTSTLLPQCCIVVVALVVVSIVVVSSKSLAKCSQLQLQLEPQVAFAVPTLSKIFMIFHFRCLLLSPSSISVNLPEENSIHMYIRLYLLVSFEFYAFVRPHFCGQHSHQK